MSERLPRSLDKRLHGEGHVEEDSRTDGAESNPHASLPDYYQKQLQDRVNAEARRVAEEMKAVRKAPRRCMRCRTETYLKPPKMVQAGWKKKGGCWLCPECAARKKLRNKGRLS